MTSALRIELLERAGRRCEECGAEAPDDSHLHAHHLSYEATDGPDNRRLLCARCHKRAHLAPDAPTPPRTGTHHLSIYLSDEQLKALEAIAWKEQRPVGYVAREMIARGLAKREKVG